MEEQEEERDADSRMKGKAQNARGGKGHSTDRGEQPGRGGEAGWPRVAERAGRGAAMAEGFDRVPKNEDGRHRLRPPKFMSKA